MQIIIATDAGEEVKKDSWIGAIFVENYLKIKNKLNLFKILNDYNLFIYIKLNK